MIRGRLITLLLPIRHYIFMFVKFLFIAYNKNYRNHNDYYRRQVSHCRKPKKHLRLNDSFFLFLVLTFSGSTIERTKILINYIITNGL